jgi:hypothetical protein
MNEPSFDELASAHLDGATTPEEAARVAADPALQARVVELRQVRAAMAAAPAIDPARRDAAIAAALAAFTEDARPSQASASVTSLAAVTDRRGSSGRAVRALGAAAAVVVLALLVPLLGRLAQSTDDEATSFDSTGAAIESGGDALGGAPAGEATSDATSTTAQLPAQDLGTFDDIDALVAALSAEDVDSAFGPSVGTVDGSQEDGLGCEVPTASGANTARTQVATATVAGDAVIVIVRTDATGARTLLLYRTDGCTPLAEREL